VKIDESGKTVLRVIVIEDDPDDLDLLLRELRRGGYKTKHAHVESRAALEEALAEGSWDIVISDWSLPSFDGLAAFRVVRAADGDLPFIIVSGTIAEEHAVEALKAGVNDFITKGRFARLLPAIDRELREAEGRRQKKLAEASLERQREETERSERLLRSVLQSVPDGVIVVDKSGAIKEWNASATAILGMPPTDKPVSDWCGHFGFYLPDRVTLAPDGVMARAMRGISVDREEFFVRNAAVPKGTWVNASSRPLRDAEGNVTGALCVFRDVSKEKSSQEQLMISDRMASVGMLAAGVAHEINNPLGAALLNLESVHDMLSKAPDNRDEKELNVAMRDARGAVARVREIVRDLKLFSRHEDGAQDRADVKEALESSLRMAFNEIRHRAGVVKNYADTPTIKGSESRLGQVFLNLLVNAAQAIPEGNIDANTITVRTSLDADGNAVVEISDTGAGIKPEDVPNLFTPFFTTKPPGIGTGLGLPICQRIIAQMGGTISVESEVGKGTTFRVVLPPARALSDGRSMRVPPLISAPPPAHRRGRVLVVDDEEMLAAAIRRVLSRQHDVVTTTRAEDALARLRAGEKFDVIFSDLMMPQITGMELFDRISKEFPEHAPRVVFLTGGAFTQAAREFLAKVSNPTLEKPVDRASLIALVSDRLKEMAPSIAV
jgi:signal transduction histidine kinase/DNA-binding response OmpR family regulator